MPEHPDHRKYYVTWEIDSHPEGLAREEVEAMKTRSAAHDVIIFSLIHTPDGGLSTLINGRHHTGREMNAAEYYKAWTLMTELVRRKLVEAGEADGPGTRLSFVKVVWDTICDALSRPKQPCATCNGAGFIDQGPDSSVHTCVMCGGRG